MADTPPADWTAWLIGTVGTLALSIAGMGKFIASMYAARVAQLEKDVAATQLKFDNYVVASDKRIQEIVDKHEECMQAHTDASIKLASLETQIKLTNLHVASNTKELKEGREH